MKKNRILLRILLSLFSCAPFHSIAQYVEMQVDQLDFNFGFSPLDDTLKLGYLDSTMKFIIPPIYSNGSDFQNGYANIIRDSVYGIIDLHGNESLFPQFDQTYFYKSDLGLALKKDKWGYINRKGEIVIPLQFTSANFFNEGFAGIAIEGQWMMIDESGHRIFSSEIRTENNMVYDSMVVFTLGTVADSNSNQGVPGKKASST